MSNSLRLALLLVAISLPAQAQSPPTVVHDRYPLTRTENGVDGFVQLRLDARLTDDLKKEMWGKGDWSFVLPESDPRYKDFQAVAPQNAKLEIVSNSGELISTSKLERPLARIKRTELQSGHVVFLLTSDESFGSGSYAGLKTQFFEIAAGQLHWLEENGSQIWVTSSLKSDWKIVRYKKAKDILAVSCFPAKVQVNADDFVVTYTRFRLIGNRWVQFKRAEKGFWESDEGFPPLSKFP